jgi:intracellular sulfur oxidation DsrE/DsrF family protein
MNKANLIAVLISGFLFSAAALADDGAQNNVCPPAYQAQIDTEFGSSTNGTTTSAITTCISNHHHIRNVLNMSTAVLNPKSGINQTLNNASLMIANYKNVYGITLGDDFKLNVVAHFQGGQFLLTDTAYIATHPGATGNPSRAMVESLLAQGVHVYMCQNTMRANAWKTPDLIPGVEETPAGVVALFDFTQSGWAVVTP